MPRSFLASLSGLLAAVLLPLSIAGVWVHEVVSDTDRYVDTVAPLADDDVVRSAAVDVLTRQALQIVATTGVTLPPGEEALVRSVVEGVVDSPGFRTAWVRANRSVHDQIVAVLEDERDVQLDSEGRVTIDLTGILQSVLGSLTAQDTSGAVDLVAVSGYGTLPVMDRDQLAQVRRGYDLLDTLGFWLPVAWAAAVLLMLLLARRRLATTSRLALASLVTLGLLAAALAFARDAATEDLPQRDVALAIWDVLLSSLWHEIAVAAVVLVAVAVVAGGLSVVAGRRNAPPGDPGGALI